MNPLAPSTPAELARSIEGLVEEAKKHAHQAIEDLGPVVTGADASCDDAIIEIAKLLYALTGIEESLAEAIRQDGEVQS